MKLIDDFANNYLIEIIIAAIFGFLIVELIVAQLRNKAKIWIGQKNKLIFWAITTGVIFVILNKIKDFIAGLIIK